MEISDSLRVAGAAHHPHQREAGVSAFPYAGEPLIRGRLEGFLTLSGCLTRVRQLFWGEIYESDKTRLF